MRISLTAKTSIQPGKAVWVSEYTGSNVGFIVRANLLEKWEVIGRDAQPGQGAYRCQSRPMRFVDDSPAKLIGRLLSETFARQNVDHAIAPGGLSQRLLVDREKVMDRRQLAGDQFKAQGGIHHVQSVVLAVENGVEYRPDAVSRGKNRCLLAEII